MKRHRGLLWAGLAAVLAAACGRAAPARSARTLALTPCRLEGAPTDALCGTLEVWEDRAAARGRRIRLNVAVFPALAREAAPDPLFLLAGGPGQGITRTASLVAAFGRVRRQRDVVLVDQRGTGGSAPLDCRLGAEDEPLTERLDDAGFSEQRLRECLESYPADVRLYTTPAAAADLDAVRAALGYERLNLWGISYGTRAALVYMRDFAPRVRSAVLDGAAPYSNRLPLFLARDAHGALERVLADCTEDPGCARAYPSLEPRFRALLARLEQGPDRVSVADPLSGEPSDVTIRHQDFVSGLRSILYSADSTPLVPLIVDRAERGDYGPFVAQLTTFQQGYEKTMSVGLLFSVVCTEDVPFIAPGEVERESAGTFLGATVAREMMQICEWWPRGTLPAEYREPVRSDVPTLLLAGELDPVTPRRWAEEVKAGLARSWLLEVPGVAHGTTWHGCVPDLVARFIADGTAASIDTTCVEALGRPPFFVSFAGPQP